MSQLPVLTHVFPRMYVFYACFGNDLSQRGGPPVIRLHHGADLPLPLLPPIGIFPTPDVSEDGMEILIKKQADDIAAYAALLAAKNAATAAAFTTPTSSTSSSPSVSSSSTSPPASSAAASSPEVSPAASPIEQDEGELPTVTKHPGRQMSTRQTKIADNAQQLR